MSEFKPITIVGLNSRVEIEFDINLVMQMYHAYISYLPIEQRNPREQLLLSKQMLVFQDLYNAEQKAALEYIEKKADEEAVRQAGVGPHYDNKSEPQDSIDDLLANVRKTEFVENTQKPCPLCWGTGRIENPKNKNVIPCMRCNGAGIIDWNDDVRV